MLDFTSLPPAFPPQMIAAIPPQSLPLPSVLAGPESSPAALPEPALLARFDRLCLRFALPLAEDEAREALAREAEALQRHGMADLAYLGCSAVCLARVEALGGALALGLWAGSALLAHVGAVAPGTSAVALPGELAAAFLAAVELGEMPVLRLLVGAALQDRFLSRLQALSATSLPATQALAGDGVRLVLDGPPAATSPVLELIPSQLFALLRTAIGWADRLADARIDPADMPIRAAGPAVLLAGEWPSLLPVLPPGLPLVDPVDGLGALIARGTEAAAGLPLDAHVGLAVHLGLTWALAAITDAYPAAGWLALLEALPPAALASGLAAAEHAGIPTLLPFGRPQRGAVDSGDGRWALGAPPRPLRDPGPWRAGGRDRARSRSPAVLLAVRSVAQGPGPRHRAAGLPCAWYWRVRSTTCTIGRYCCPIGRRSLRGALGPWHRPPAPSTTIGHRTISRISPLPPCSPSARSLRGRRHLPRSPA